MACYFVYCGQNALISANKQDIVLCTLQDVFALDCRVYAIVAAMVFPVVLVVCAPFSLLIYN
eukprot:3921748-Pleurochrysis_carterae.AAC.1